MFRPRRLRSPPAQPPRCSPPVRSRLRRHLCAAIRREQRLAQNHDHHKQQQQLFDHDEEQDVEQSPPLRQPQQEEQHQDGKEDKDASSDHQRLKQQQQLSDHDEEQDVEESPPLRQSHQKEQQHQDEKEDEDDSSNHQRLEQQQRVKEDHKEPEAAPCPDVVPDERPPAPAPAVLSPCLARGRRSNGRRLYRGLGCGRGACALRGTRAGRTNVLHYPGDVVITPKPRQVQQEKQQQPENKEACGSVESFGSRHDERREAAGVNLWSDQQVQMDVMNKVLQWKTQDEPEKQDKPPEPEQQSSECDPPPLPAGLPPLRTPVRGARGRRASRSRARGCSMSTFQGALCLPEHHPDDVARNADPRQITQQGENKQQQLPEKQERSSRESPETMPKAQREDDNAGLGQDHQDWRVQVDVADKVCDWEKQERPVRTRLAFRAEVNPLLNQKDYNTALRAALRSGRSSWTLEALVDMDFDLAVAHDVHQDTLVNVLEALVSELVQRPRVCLTMLNVALLALDHTSNSTRDKSKGILERLNRNLHKIMADPSTSANEDILRQVKSLQMSMKRLSNPLGVLEE